MPGTHRLTELTFTPVRATDPPTQAQLETYYGLEQMVTESEVVVVCPELGRVIEGTSEADFAIRYTLIV